MYIASKSAVSEIRSFVSPVINSLPNSSNRSVTRQGFWGKFLNTANRTQNPFLGLCKEAVMVSLYKKKPRKTVDFPWLLKYLIEKS